MKLENLEPVTRMEAILNGDDVEPVTREEYFWQMAATNGGGAEIPLYDPESDSGKSLFVGYEGLVWGNVLQSFVLPTTSGAVGQRINTLVSDMRNYCITNSVKVAVMTVRLNMPGITSTSPIVNVVNSMIKGLPARITIGVDDSASGNIVEGFTYFDDMNRYQFWFTLNDRQYQSQSNDWYGIARILVDYRQYPDEPANNYIDLTCRYIYLGTPVTP